MQEPPTSVVSERSVEGYRRFANLRGVQWRVNLGILPSSPSSSIDDLRRVTADSRRRYAGLRRRLLIDPHMPKDGSTSPDLVIDNPLSQNPDSTWGRFFRNAELEKTVDQDLSRLYPEHESYFQTPGCQGMLRRILLLWCLRHPEYGYRQGMHELLAPLLYVLHVDVTHLSEVRKTYEDHFTDKFDGLSFQENDVTYNFDFKKFLESMEDELGSQGNSKKVKSLDELDPEVQTIVLLSDAYGAEGELGIVLSEKFMEHDAYCMFDALMNGAHGSVAMAEFFAHSPASGSETGLPPVLEASAALYHLLSLVDSSLYNHLVELGVEPQYFSLRWLRVLFGREFSLDNLLVVWDEIFEADNTKLDNGVKDGSNASNGILNSPRGALIAAMAVSMILYLRSSLLATENATSCLQRLLNFPESIDLRKLIKKAKSLQTLALDIILPSTVPSFDSGISYNHSKSVGTRRHTLSYDSVSPKTPLTVVPDSYWEEKWRVLHKAEEQRQGIAGKQNATQKKGWSERVKLKLSRTESDPSPAKFKNGKKEPRASIRRSLLDDLSRQLGSEEDAARVESTEVLKSNGHHYVDVDSHEVPSQKDDISMEVEVEGHNGLNKDFSCPTEESSLSGNAGSEENSSIFSDPTSPARGTSDPEIDSEKSSFASNVSFDENDNDPQRNAQDSPLPVSHPNANASPEFQCNNDSTGKAMAGMKERKSLSGRFPWFWKFGKNSAGEEVSDKGVTPEAPKSISDESSKSDSGSFTADCPRNLSCGSKGDLDQNVMGTLRNLGQSMIEHIQVIESVFQQDRGQVGSRENFSKNVLVGKGQVTAMTALKELRKISNLLSEM